MDINLDIWVLIIFETQVINKKRPVRPVFPDSLFVSWSKGLMVKTLDSQSRGPVFKTTEWLQGRLSLSYFLGR